VAFVISGGEFVIPGDVLVTSWGKFVTSVEEFVTDGGEFVTPVLEVVTSAGAFVTPVLEVEASGGTLVTSVEEFVTSGGVEFVEAKATVRLCSFEKGLTDPLLAKAWRAKKYVWPGTRLATMPSTAPLG
jgi:hypothetical protein